MRRKPEGPPGWLLRNKMGRPPVPGKVSAEIAKLHALTGFEKYHVIQDKQFMSDFDRYLLELEEKTKQENRN